ncbi:hypothetical protein [Rhodovulum adriaticum]|uniref:Uncharacterized protein n=1 Tax=Rhodovulum adriaticum TaxID=35804 RepID=A0A4R2NHV1_RHOAD|nr:hypothetical protein [Rhodovulum adriaticum]MBK1635821.1 hypothetical protein [Rhodovulum adriaticum]TCP21013.1 hypothetical protein EV656_11431 [Rhodovulum adriaticum]
MTALTRYERLESPGLWRETAQAQRRDVILSFGDASLVISDTAERVLTHWSLAAIARINPGRMPALYTPDPDGDETLEVDEPVMIEAIEAVRAAIARERPRAGRLRLVLLGLFTAGFAALALFWLPGALARHAVTVVPVSVRAEIGRDVLARITRINGPACHARDGVAALERLTARVLPETGAQVVVLSGGTGRAAHLPGGLILLNRALVEDHEDPAVAAGFILAESARAARNDPLAELLRTAGPLATLRLLTSGRLPDAALEAHAKTVLNATPRPLPQDAALLARFAAAQLSSVPYAYALDASGESVLPLIEADPMRGRNVPQVLSDGDWIRLQGICGP